MIDEDAISHNYLAANIYSTVPCRTCSMEGTDIEKDKEYRDVTTCFGTGRAKYPTVIIKKTIAKRYGFDRGTHLIVEGVEKGVLIRRLEF